MKTYSSIYPERYWVRKRELGDVYLRLRKNIQEQEVENEQGIETIYEFDEVEVVIADRPNLDEYVDTYFDELFNMGIAAARKLPAPSNTERIDALEKAMLDMILGGKM